MEKEQVNPATRNVPLKWVRRLVKNLSDDELETIRHALGGIPMEPDFGGIENLFERARQGAVHLYTLPVASGFQAATFFELQRLPDGSLNFHSLATVACGGTGGPRLAQTDVPEMEAVARSLGCKTISLGTIRPGLVAQLVEAHGWRIAEIICRKSLAP